MFTCVLYVLDQYYDNNNIFAKRVSAKTLLILTKTNGHLLYESNEIFFIFLHKL